MSVLEQVLTSKDKLLNKNVSFIGNHDKLRSVQ